MKLLSFFLGCLLVLTTTPAAFAVEASTNAAPVAPAPAAAKDKKSVAQAKSTPTNADVLAETNVTSVAQPAELKFDEYLKELTDTLKLSDEEKKAIQTYYLSDGMLLKNILNNDAISPLQKAQQVSDVRDARNTKIEALLQDDDRQRAFLKVEAQYRVALTVLAADGGLVPALPPSVAPSSPSAVSVPVGGKAPDAKPAAK